MPINVYVLENHPIVQEILCDFLNQLPDLRVCGAADTPEEALAQLPMCGADLVLFDLALPTMNGLDFLKIVRIYHPDLRCITFSTHVHTADARRALAAGAQGYVVKTYLHEIEEAIFQVLAGQVYVSPQLRSWL